ncbi:beta-CASP ribonuclease aCPSF1 [Infirmifilum lucidum]|uniref:Transcription termination factor FttA n=1 Tax=Infirmifilum lucidum TaxID=2776706 RepID=A0A7L9FFB8_9CREN|nr:beta-CASP ribonuclease aCPSF1 [Infirmifilum lucidum]
MESVTSIAREVREAIFSNLPPNAEITKIDFEGPKIAIYTRRPQIFLENDGELIKRIAKTIRKRVIVRGDETSRLDEKTASEIINSLIPKETGLKNIYFNESIGEVEIELLYPERVEQAILTRIFVETLWYPRVLRRPPVVSRSVREIREIYHAEVENRRRFLRDLGDRVYRKPIFKTDRVRIAALGAFQEVGRSAILVQTPETNILLDAGLKPTGNSDELPMFDLPEFDVDSLDAVVVTHAHLDHIGALPLLFKYGYKGPVYMTEPTLHLAKLLFEDYIKVSEKEGKPLLFSTREISSVILHTYTLNYGEVTDIAPEVRLTLYRAGHILGSALVHLHIGEGLINLVYTGDLKFARTMLLDPAHTKFPRAEVLIVESTYGSKNDILPSEEEARLELAKIILETIEKKGIVLIPVLAVGRAQEVLLAILDLIRNKIIPPVPIFIEGMIDEVSAVHMTFPEYLSLTVRNQVYNDQNPFTSENIHVYRGENKEEVTSTRPAIVLATSGMLTGGPVLEYLKILADDPNSSLVFVSYQVEGTLGRKILQGLRKLTFSNEGGKTITKDLKMGVYRVEGFSGHSDRRQLEAFLRRMEPTPRTVILNHGEKNKIEEFRSYLLSDWFRKKTRLSFNVLAPQNAESVRIV